ncbi:hypothetical protein B0E38_01793 [Streptomyces sp. 111WW2]|uniref:hypothetical protein n=1 Tax=Streptomyces sp. 111WW2 TaxID=1945515 RepID=UPI000D0C94D0|nr:hypothetical protein [Streptomyces sp. 111WW2]PSK57948.1 hypothetical protein B0E38_01793 [Streptomyces sp. 111WW2]
MRKVATLTKVWGTTLILLAMTPKQVSEWKWVGDEMQGEDPVLGWEVRDVTGALLGVILPLGHRASRIHAEWYDPATNDFYFAGVTNAPILKHGVSRVLSNRRYEVGPVPTGEGFSLRPNHIPVECLYSRCAAGCAHCAARRQAGEAVERAREAALQAPDVPQSTPAPQGPAVQLELAFAA